ncbi:BBE domain-containing protein [Paenibacillus sp. NPDC056722]
MTKDTCRNNYCILSAIEQEYDPTNFFRHTHKI